MTPEVSTLEVEEVFGFPAESQITQTSVEIVHKGTPPGTNLIKLSWVVV